MYLVDTNVISEAAPTKTARRTGLETWMNVNADYLFISTVTVAELQDGITHAALKGAVRKAARLEGWLDTLVHLYDSRILPFDVATARLAGQLLGAARARGSNPDFADIAIAATARHFGYTVLTRNLRHFADFDFPAHDPFDTLPSPARP